jgi:hypothetical protein
MWCTNGMADSHKGCAAAPLACCGLIRSLCQLCIVWVQVASISCATSQGRQLHLCAPNWQQPWRTYCNRRRHASWRSLHPTTAASAKRLQQSTELQLVWCAMLNRLVSLQAKAAAVLAQHGGLCCAVS